MTTHSAPVDATTEERTTSLHLLPPPQAAAAAPVADVFVEGHAPLDIGPWLQRIREQRDRGDLEAARASLARFVQAHPGHPLPDDLKALR